MTDASFASLSPRLLARKGGAKPAMRSQLNMPGTALGSAAQANLDDLGWNDLGEDAAPAEPLTAEIIAIASARPKQTEVAASSASSVDAPRVKTALRNRGERAAFTLRLDPERHLKLRLACTVRHCSAQQLVTDALDALLGGMSDIQKLAAQVGSN